MKPIIILLASYILLFESAYSQSSGNNDWFWQYPKPQGNTLNDIHVFNRDTAIAVGDLGTVIKTTDRGENWSVQHHAAGTAQDLSGVYFIDELRGWAVGGTALIRTEDGGSNWTEITLNISLALRAVYFVDADTGIAVGNDGIVLRTSDGGNNWDIKTIDDYIGYGWLDVFDLHEITFTDKQSGWIVGYGYYGNQIYRTTDCGRTWQWNEQIIQPKVFGALYDICFTDRNHGFITGELGTFLKTTDGGISWQYQDLSEKYQNEEYQYFNASFFADSLKGWIVGAGFILETVDGGENWNEFSTGIGLRKVRFAQVYGGFPSELSGWAIGGYGIIYRTTDAGENWISQREKRYNFRSVYFTDENTGWAVGDSGIILSTTNGGDNWIKQFSADSIILSSVYAIDNQNVFVVGSIIKGLSILNRKGLLLKTNNGGQIWIRQDYDSLYGFNSIIFVNDSIGWISETEGALLKTVNKGNNWYKIILDSNVIKASGKIRFVNQLTGWIGGVLKTTDGGENWLTQTIPIMSLNSYDFVDVERGWAVASSNGSNNIFKTTDGGENWSPCGITPSGYNFSLQFINETTGWISGFDNLNRISVIIKTTDGGYAWTEQKCPCKNEGGLSNLFFLDENTGWAVGEGIIKTINGGGTVSVKKVREYIPKQIELYQNYPNPFNPATTISFSVWTYCHTSLRVYDLLGREVAVLVNEQKSAGRYTVHWNAEKLSSGVYFYKLCAGKYSETKKMILIR